MNAKILSVMFALLVHTPFTWAISTLSWSFDQTDFIVLSSDQIVVTATVRNSSDQPYTIPGVGGSFGGLLQTHYDFTFMVGELSNQTVPANGDLQFTFGTLTPLGGCVAPGTYFADPAALNFGTGLLPSENTFQITVLPTGCTPYVPPLVPDTGSGALLLLIGLSSLVALRRLTSLLAAS
jgi:hypothetical protein